MGFLSDMNRFAKSRAKYKEFCGDPDKKANSLYFGICSIVQSVVTVALAAVTMFLFGLANGDNPVLVIVGLLFGVALGIGAVGTFFCSLVNMTRQLKMNGRAVGKIAVLFFVLEIVGIVVAAVLILLK